MNIKTKTGKKYEVGWAAVSTIDGYLRIQLNIPMMQEAVFVFSDPNETETLIYNRDSIETSFDGYVDLVGVRKTSGNAVIVTLKKGD